MRSLERQLPLAAFALLTVLAASITWAAYGNARSTTRELFSERLTRVASELAASTGPGVMRVRALVAAAAEDSAIVGVLSTPRTSTPEAAGAALQRSIDALEANVVVGVWDLSGDLMVSLGVDTAAWVSQPHYVEEPTVMPIEAAGDSIVHYGAVAPVRDGRQLVGFVQLRQRLVGGAGGQRALLEALIGESGRVLLGSHGGGWTDLRTVVEGPPAQVSEVEEVLAYERAGVRVLGIGRTIPETDIVIVAEVGEDAALGPARSFLTRVSIIAALLVALATFAAWRLGHRITGPLTELRVVAEEVGAGAYARRAPESGHPEIVHVARTFNRMAADMEVHLGALRQSEQRFRSLVTATAQIVWWMDAEGNVTQPIPSFQAYTGMSFDQVRGAGWTGAVHPDDAAGALHAWRQAVERQSLYEIEYRLRRRDGEYRWFLTRGVPVLEADGAIREWVGTCTDITKRRETEQILRNKELELQQSQRLDAVGRLAGGIAHDFNNLLTAIMSPADMADRQLPADHPAREELKEIRGAAQRASELTRKLLAFGRQQVMAPVVLDLNEVVESAGKLLSRVIGESIRLELALEAADATVRVDRTQMEQIIVNLAVNARDAMPDGGRLTIETADVEMDEMAADAHPGLRSGRYALLAVTDTGTGMDVATKKQIFEPFFTTKADKGTGLGLSTVYGIVRQSGGHILVYSEPGRGSTFKIYLPRAVAPASRERAPTPDLSLDELPGGDETILFAEDDAAIRRLGIRILERLGYRVLPAGGGAEALELAAEHLGEIDLLLSDVVMSGMSGLELWERLRSRQSHLPGLFISGWASEAVVTHGILDGQVPFLQKPFSAQELARKVRDVLDHGEAA